jgi:hypothetical protein
MKRSKLIVAAILLLSALAFVGTGCTYGHVCQANKVGNHR